MSDLEVLQQRYRQFVADRDWSQFHDPKSLVLALVGEVGELAELFQWLPADRAAAMAQNDPLKTRAAEEVSDVLIYLLALTDALGIDLIPAALAKLEKSAAKYPVAEFTGTAPDRAAL